MILAREKRKSEDKLKEQICKGFAQDNVALFAAFPRSSYASQVAVVIHLSFADKVVISSCSPSVDNRILNILLDVGPSLSI